MCTLIESAMACLTFVATARAADTLPVETFFAAPTVRAARLSPDARHLAVGMATKGGQARLLVVNLDDMRPVEVAG